MNGDTKILGIGPTTSRKGTRFQNSPKKKFKLTVEYGECGKVVRDKGGLEVIKIFKMYNIYIDLYRFSIEFYSEVEGDVEPVVDGPVQARNARLPMNEKNGDNDAGGAERLATRD